MGLLLCAIFACLVHANDPSQYEFGYAVNDPITGDQKDQRETKNGDNVSGYYRTLDSDGLLRTVKYKADDVNGFTAEVVREPVPGAAIKAAVPQQVTRAHAAPAPAALVSAPYYLGPSWYGYNNRPSYSYGYQPYSAYNGYQAYPYSYGYQPYYGYRQYPFSVYK